MTTKSRLVSHAPTPHPLVQLAKLSVALDTLYKSAVIPADSRTAFRTLGDLSWRPAVPYRKLNRKTLVISCR